jgi:hypothetical protein
MMRDRITKASDWHRDYSAPHRFARSRHFMTLEPSMICTLVLENGRRNSLLYLRVTTVSRLLRLVEQVVKTGPWTHIEISKI